MGETVAELPLAQIKRFERTMKRIPEEIREDVLLDLGEGLIGEAQFNAPVDTGHLAESHFVSDYNQGEVIIGANAPYAFPVHETHPTKAHWFINAITRNFERMTKASIRKHLKRRGAK